MPMTSAFSARLQCVALGGLSCTVLAITFSLVAIGSGGTREGRVLSRLSPFHALVEIPLLPTPDRRFRHVRPSHDLEGAMTVSHRQHATGPPDQFAWSVAVGDQGL